MALFAHKVQYVPTINPSIFTEPVFLSLKSTSRPLEPYLLTSKTYLIRRHMLALPVLGSVKAWGRSHGDLEHSQSTPVTRQLLLMGA